jgi:hypothetical protein
LRALAARANSPSRDKDLLAVAATLAALALACCGCDGSAHPNLLLVTVDSLRADRLECYGGESGVGARICDLGDVSTRYSWAFATASSSAPAVASILTSRYPSDHGVRANPASFLRSSATSLAEPLRAAGYLTTAVVSSPELSRSRNLHQGFARFDDDMSRIEGTEQTTRKAAETTEAALAWLRTAESPWFLWVHYRDLNGAYDEVAYDGVLREIDHEIGRLIDGLEAEVSRLGVLLTADRGTAFGEEGRDLVHRHPLGLEQIRVPLLWRPPRYSDARKMADESGAVRSALAARSVTEPVSTLAVAPTLLAAAGVQAPEAFHGRPLRAIASEAESDRIEPLFAEHPLRIALVSGSHYYSRDRAATLIIAADEEEGEPLLDLGALARADARVAELWVPRAEGDASDQDASRRASSQQLPPTESARPTGIAPYLEPLVADFLARQVESPRPPEAGPDRQEKQ